MAESNTNTFIPIRTVVRPGTAVCGNASEILVRNDGKLEKIEYEYIGGCPSTSMKSPDSESKHNTPSQDMYELDCNPCQQTYKSGQIPMKRNNSNEKMAGVQEKHKETSPLQPWNKRIRTYSVSEIKPKDLLPELAKPKTSRKRTVSDGLLTCSRSRPEMLKMLDFDKGSRKRERSLGKTQLINVPPTASCKGIQKVRLYLINRQQPNLEESNTPSKSHKAAIKESEPETETIQKEVPRAESRHDSARVNFNEDPQSSLDQVQQAQSDFIVISDDKLDTVTNDFSAFWLAESYSLEDIHDIYDIEETELLYNKWAESSINKATELSNTIQKVRLNDVNKQQTNLEETKTPSNSDLPAIKESESETIQPQAAPQDDSARVNLNEDPQSSLDQVQQAQSDVIVKSDDNFDTTTYGFLKNLQTQTEIPFLEKTLDTKGTELLDNNGAELLLAKVAELLNSTGTELLDIEGKEFKECETSQSRDGLPESLAGLQETEPSENKPSGSKNNL